MFAPSNIQRSLCGACPTLAEADKAYGRGGMTAWMTMHLTNLSNYMGYANLPNTTQVEGVLEQFMQKYSFLRVTEVMYYFECIKDGRYYEATVKLEPTRLIKGVVEYLGHLNTMKERWGTMEEFNDEALRKFCRQMMPEKVDIKAYPQEEMALLLGWYLPVTEKKYRTIKNKIISLDNSWVNELN